MKPAIVLLRDIFANTNIVEKKIPPRPPKKLALKAHEMATLESKFDLNDVPMADRFPTIECEISDNIPLKVFFDSNNEIVDIIQQSHSKNIHHTMNEIKHLTQTLFEKLLPNVPKNDEIVDKLILSMYYTGLNVAIPNNATISKKLVELLNLPLFSK